MSFAEDVLCTAADLWKSISLLACLVVLGSTTGLKHRSLFLQERLRLYQTKVSKVVDKQKGKRLPRSIVKGPFLVSIGC